MKEIGGYLELELNKIKNNDIHCLALPLNSGRNALRALLKAKNITNINIPYYICETVIDAIQKEGVNYHYYSIDENFLPKEINENYHTLYVNYFGILDKNVAKITKKLKNCIIDNTHAFYSMPIKNTDAFYSTRKFFGVPDGGYLYSTIKVSQEYPQDFSADRFKHLLDRIDKSANDAYPISLHHEDSISEFEIKKMSTLTKTILSSINFKEAREKRIKNFQHLNKHLKKQNLLSINTKEINTPMVYPFLVDTPMLKEKLIKNKVYIATYWRETLDKVNSSSFEAKLTNNLNCLPIDQRYDKKDMDRILEIILN